MTGIGVTKVFKADLRRLPLAQQGKALEWLLAFNDDPDDPRFEAHRLKKALMPDLWTAKLDSAYLVGEAVAVPPPVTRAAQAGARMTG